MGVIFFMRPMAKIRVAINGFGRIGRLAFRSMLQAKGIEVVGINDLGDTPTMAHLFKYDTAYGTYDGVVSSDENHIYVNKKKYPAFSERDPEALPWKKLKVDIVLECTGVFRKKEGAEKHLTAGAKRVIISAPAKSDGISCYVRGANDKEYANEAIIDNASCTTNSAVPVMKVLEETFGVEKAMLTTVHSYTATQNLQDGLHKDLREARAAAMNLIPAETGSAIATTRVIPALEGKFHGMAVRVPNITVSLTDITAVLSEDVSVDAVNAAFVKASKKSLKGILAVNNEPLVSSDFVGNPHSAIVDLPLTKVVGGNLVKIIVWYDNEWGYANRLVEMMQAVGKKL